MGIQRALDALLRQDLPSFVAKCISYLASGQVYETAWFVDPVCRELERCRRGDNQQQVITLPPRHLKSSIASVAFPAFVLGHQPERRIVCISASKDVAEQQARYCRSIMAVNS